jgi:hypothetical protein
MYVMLASALLIATIVYVAKVVGRKLKAPKILEQDPRKPGGGTQ